MAVFRWDKGEYFGSNNGGSGANYNHGPDDLNVITTNNGFGYHRNDRRSRRAAHAVDR